MLLAPTTRIGLSQADMRDFQSRYEARHSLHQTQVKLGGLRLRSTSSRSMRASITKAYDNDGQTRADSCSSEATICSDDDGTCVPLTRSPPLQHDRFDMDDTYNNPLLDPGAPVFVSRTRFGSSSRSTAQNVDCYPPFRRPLCPQRTSSRRHLDTYERNLRSHNDLRTESSHRSSPNLLLPRSPTLYHEPRIRTRSSSLTWDRHQENERQVPRMVSVANRVSTSSSAEVPLDVLSRDSPLDELSQQLGRMASSTHHSRSMERPWEHTPGRNRIALLSGNLFQLNSQSDMTNIVPEDLSYRPLSPAFRDVVKPDERRDSIMDPGTLYELSLALPSPHIQQSSPVSASSRSPPLTPSQAWLDRASSSSMLDSTPLVAPHLVVYDDSLPSTQQPQTPADLARSTARPHRPSPSVARRIDDVRRIDQQLASNLPRDRQTSPLHNTSSSSPPRPIMSSQSARRTLLPEHRSSPLQHSSTPVQPQQRVSPRQQSATPLLRRTHRYSRSGNSENDVESALETVEEDRRMWTIRREHGGLEVTPPAEGRYERYFS